MKTALYTIGHSNHALDEFLGLVRRHRISAIADVRSQPTSGYCTHFNGEALKRSLQAAGIDYVFLGKELGARRDERECYVDGKARYERIAGSAAYQAGLDRIRRGAAAHRIALMCAEKDPLTCHRTILIARDLKEDFDIRHIIGPDEVETHAEVEARLIEMLGLPRRDLFRAPEEILDDAYAMQAERIAYVESDVSLPVPDPS